MEVVKVQLGARSYEIRIGGDLESLIASAAGPLRLGGHVVIVVTDTETHKRFGPRVIAALSEVGAVPVEITFRSGERTKNLANVEWIYHFMLQAGCDRGSWVVALGGGVIGDLAGFAAATFMRGVDFIQIPTTLLSQVDASVGGKTGVDLIEGKNLVGAFHQPRGVLIDPCTLMTLPMRQCRAGLAEVVKHAVIADAGLFEYIERHAADILSRQTDPMAFLIRRSCEIKADIVSRDERESGLRGVLNYGHTVGHAIEACAGYRGPLHGEAVAIGMVVAADIAVRMGMLSMETAKRQRDLLERLGLPTRIDPDLPGDRIVELTGLDKKSKRRTPRFVLPTHIGYVKRGIEVPPELLAAAVAAARGVA